MDLYDAARVDGAGPVSEFFAVTLPSLRNEMVVALTLTVIFALRNFDLIWVSTGGGPGDATTVPSVLLYELGLPGSAAGHGIGHRRHPDRPDPGRGHPHRPHR